MAVCNGIEIVGDPPPVAGNFRGRCLVIGSGHNMWEDSARLWKLDSERSYEYMGVNFGGAFWPYPLHHFVSLHANYIKHWVGIRLASGSQHYVHTHAHKQLEGVGTAWTFVRQAGMSGLFACKVALALGYEQVVLVGNPIDDKGHFYDPPKGWTMGNEFSWEGTRYRHRGTLLEWECAATEEFQGRVKSMSGYTRELLGEPK